MKPIVSYIYIILSVIITIDAYAQKNKTTFPKKKWEVVKNPEDLGFSKEKLLEAKKHGDKSNSAAVMIIVGGKVAYQWGEVDRKYSTHSIRKSMISAMYGKYVKSGQINMDATMEELGIDDVDTLSALERTATVRDLLKSRSGVYHNALFESGGMKRSKPPRFSFAPGTHFYYNNWDFNVLGTIFEKYSGKKIFQAFYDDIAVPTGMQFYVPGDGSYAAGRESRHKAYPFKITASDLARFGLLMLNMGNWDGTQIIDSTWVEESTRYHSDGALARSSGYGYLWWVARDNNKYPFINGVDLPDGSYCASGVGGHSMIIIPKYDMIIVHRVNTDILGTRVEGVNFEKLIKLIMDARL